MLLGVMKDKEVLDRFNKKGLYAVLHMERNFRLPGKEHQKFQGELVQRLREYDDRIESSYMIRIPYGNFDEYKLKREIVNDLEGKLGNNIFRFVKDKLECVRVPSVRIKDVVARRNQYHKRMCEEEE